MTSRSSNVSPALAEVCIPPERTIREAIVSIDRSSKGIALIVDETNHLLGTITDGDVRRALLENVPIETPVRDLLLRKPEAYRRPITAPVGTDRAALLQIMHDRVIHQMPLVDAEGRVMDLVTLDDLLPALPLQAVIMAGGFGQRLRPLTEDVPKPMLHVGDRPLLQRTIEQLREAGIRRMNVTTHYLPEKIADHFGDGAAFGVELNYVSEDKPLGTAGAIGLIEQTNEPLLVINGDILTRVDYRAMHAYHREHRAALTVAVRPFKMTVPYGVIESAGGNVTALREKPDVNFLVNAGIYLLDPSVYEFIARDEHCDMTDVIERLLKAGRTVSSFLIHEYWLDIGKYEDYLRAQEDVKEFD